MSEQAKGAANRAKLAALLKAAGPDGVRCSEVATAMQMDERTLRYYLVNTPGNVLKAATKSHEFTRWFHPDFAEHAAAYVRKMDSRERNPNRVSDAVIERARAFIKGGETQAQVAEAIGKSRSATAKAMKVLVTSGRVQAERFPSDHPSGGQIVRYWPAGVDIPEVPAKAPRVPKKRVRVRPRKAKTPKTGQMLLAKSGPKPQSKPQLTVRVKSAVMSASAEIIIPANVKRTSCPSCTDTRFTVHQVEPFFSRPGYRPDVIGRETWAAAVYGGGV